MNASKWGIHRRGRWLAMDNLEPDVVVLSWSADPMNAALVDTREQAEKIVETLGRGDGLFLSPIEDAFLVPLRSSST